MFPNKNRLSKNKDFNLVFKQGKTFFSTSLMLKCSYNNLEISRFGIVVSLKVSKSAVIRNKTKRRIRAALRECRGCIGVGIDYVFLVKPSSPKLEFECIKQQVHKLLIMSKKHMQK